MMRTGLQQGETQWGYGPKSLMAMLREALRRRQVYRRTLRELRSLSRRELEDRGIGPGMITRLAAETAYRKGNESALRRTEISKD